MIFYKIAILILQVRTQHRRSRSTSTSNTPYILMPNDEMPLPRTLQKADADSATKLSERAGYKPITSPGPPLDLAPPRIPIPRARSSVVGSRDPCEEASISCTWTKFSAGIKNFFETNAG